MKNKPNFHDIKKLNKESIVCGNKKKKTQILQDDFNKGLEELLECLELAKTFIIEDLDIDEEDNNENF